MPATVDQLIDIYSRQLADEVINDPEFAALEKAHDTLGNPFHSQRNRVEEIKRALEKEVGIQPTTQGQVSFALKRFLKYVGSRTDEDEICRRIVIKAFYPNWTTKQQQYFDATCERMRAKSDYFISFTQRNLLTIGKPKTVRLANPINSYHRFLIRIGGAIPDPLDCPDNQLALLIHNLLIRNRFRGFFFPEHQGNSEQVMKKLTDSINQCLIFIQLVQNEMFDKSFAGMSNFCFDEYKQAVAAGKEQIFVFVNGEWPTAFIPDEDVLSDLDPWRDFVRERDPLSVRSTQFSDNSPDIKTGMELITQFVVNKVAESRDALWRNAPSDLD